MILGQLNAITHELATITAVSGGPTTQASDGLQQAFNQERMIKLKKKISEGLFGNRSICMILPDSQYIHFRDNDF